MATAKGGYYLKDGVTRVPSVTTIIGRFKEAGGLMHWAWQCGKDGKDYREERDSAANAGTMAHEAVEAWIRGKAFTFAGPQPIVERAQKSFGAFLEWADQTKLRVTHTEMPLVSEKHRFGGTFDAILLGNRRAMGDWKSSAKCYPEYLVQVAAYGKLWEEVHPGEPITGGFHLLRFDKNFGDFHHHWWGELDRAWDAFVHLRALYDIEKDLKARAS
jgi:hypothetical protein